MSRDELSLFSYEILGLVGRGGAGPHDLRRMVRQGRLLDWAGESQYYVEPKRLAALGYLEARKAPGRTRERTVYTLTEKGLDALRAWAATPARVTPLKSEPLTRILIADLVDEELTLQSFGALHGEIAELTAQPDEADASAELLPHRRENLLRVTRFLRGLLDLHLDLVEEFERDGRRRAQPNDGAAGAARR